MNVVYIIIAIIVLVVAAFHVLGDEGIMKNNPSSNIFGTIIFLYKEGFRILKKKRDMENISTTTIRGAAMGMVEVKGEVMAPKEDLIKSPFTGTNCVCCQVEIFEKEKILADKHWIKKHENELGAPFYVQDETGRMLVDPDGATVDVEASYWGTSGFGDDPPSVVIDYLEENDIKWKGLFGVKKTLGFLEKTVKPGQQLYVLGKATDNPYVEDATATEGYKDVMIAKGDLIDYFYLSNSSEKEIKNKYTWLAPSLIIFSFILMILLAVSYREVGIIGTLLIIGVVGLLFRINSFLPDRSNRT